MASKRKTAAVVPAPNIYGPENGGSNILAAWQGLYHLFGARAERFDITDEGIFVEGLTVSEGYDLDTIVRDISHRGDKVINRRVDFFPAYFWATGQEPKPFTSSAQLTIWLTMFMGGAGEKGRSPKYAKDAIQEYKNRTGLAVPRGRPRKSVNLSELGTLDESALEGIEISELTRLKETLDSVISKPAKEPVTA